MSQPVQSCVLSVHDLLNENLQISELQRPYQWSVDHATAFLLNLKNLKASLREELVHIGTVVVETQGNTTKLLDGQQRLITLLFWTALHTQSAEAQERLNTLVGESERARTALVEVREVLKGLSPTKILGVEAACVLDHLTLTKVTLSGSALTQYRQDLMNPMKSFVPLDGLSYLKAHHYESILTQTILTQSQEDLQKAVISIEKELFDPASKDRLEKLKSYFTYSHWDQYGKSDQDGFIRHVGAGLRFEMTLPEIHGLGELANTLTYRSIARTRPFQGDPYRYYLGKAHQASRQDPFEWLVEPARFGQGEPFFEWLKLFEDLDLTFSDALDNIAQRNSVRELLDESLFKPLSPAELKHTDPRWYPFLVSMREAFEAGLKAWLDAINDLCETKKAPTHSQLVPMARYHVHTRVLLGMALHWGARWWKDHILKENFDIEKRQSEITTDFISPMAKLIGLMLMRGNRHTQLRFRYRDIHFDVLPSLAMADAELHEMLDTLLWHYFGSENSQTLYYQTHESQCHSYLFSEIWDDFVEKLQTRLESKEKHNNA